MSSRYIENQKNLLTMSVPFKCNTKHTRLSIGKHYMYINYYFLSNQSYIIGFFKVFAMKILGVE